MNHKISKKVVEYAKANNCGIKLEDLTGIRKTRKQAKSFKYTLNSWSYYQLQTFVEYKAKLRGVPVIYIEPAYTSQTCHKCGLIGERNGKRFKCPHCGYTSHADVNAAWNISAWKLLAEPRPEHSKHSGPASVKSGVVYNQRLIQEGDCIKESTDTSQRATVLNAIDPRTPVTLA